MASSLRGNKEKFLTPFGRASFPYLHAPDTKFADSQQHAKYKVEVIFDKADVKPLLKQARSMIKRAINSGQASASPKLPGEELEDGKYSITFKTKHRPALFDAQGEPLEAGLKVGGGTILRVAGKCQVYEGFGHTGVTFYMNGVQIKDLKTFGADADSYGFDATDGFSVEDASDDMFADESDGEDFATAIADDEEWDGDF